jgi:hypothetical protein
MFLMAYSAVDRDLGEKASGRYAADPVPQLPAHESGSVALHCHS